VDVDVVTATGSCEYRDRKLVLAPVVGPIGNEELIVGGNVCGGDDQDLVGEIWVNVPVCVLTSGIQRIIDVRDIAFKGMSVWIEGVSCLITECDDIVGLVGWISDCLQCKVFSTCVDPYYGEAWNVLECEETFACAREVVGICNKDFLSEVTVVS
jgi:hypothetical protein